MDRAPFFNVRDTDAMEPQETELKRARQLLGNCVLFGGLSADERAAVVARARIRTVNGEETIFAIGSPGDQMMALLRGTVRISVPSLEGRELLLAIIRPGEVFGELAVLDGKERSADAIAESPCTLAILDRHDILSFFERNPSAWPKLVNVLCQRLRHTDQVFAEVALLQLPAKLAKSMLRLLDLDKTFAPRKRPVIRYSQRELANMVGGTRESVNRCLRNWQRNGIVQITEQKVRSSLPIDPLLNRWRSRHDAPPAQRSQGLVFANLLLGR